MTRCLRRFYACRSDPSWKNIVSIGDSLTEKDALIEACFRQSQLDEYGQEKPLRCKTVKLLEDPDLTQLTAELEMLVSWLHAVVAYDGNADLDLSNSEDAAEMLEKM